MSSPSIGDRLLSPASSSGLQTSSFCLPGRELTSHISEELGTIRRKLWHLIFPPQTYPTCKPSTFPPPSPEQALPAPASGSPIRAQESTRIPSALPTQDSAPAFRGVSVFTAAASPDLPCCIIPSSVQTGPASALSSPVKTDKQHQPKVSPNCWASSVFSLCASHLSFSLEQNSVKPWKHLVTNTNDFCPMEASGSFSLFVSLSLSHTPQIHSTSIY